MEDITKNTYNYVIGLALIILIIYLIFAYRSPPTDLTDSKSKSKENFIDDYYSLNWVSPGLTKYVNTQKVCMNHRECTMNRMKTDGDKSPRTTCTYSMSCDYTNDTAHPRCYKGYDSPGDGDLDKPYDIPRSHSI